MKYWIANSVNSKEVFSDVGVEFKLLLIFKIPNSNKSKISGVHLDIHVLTVHLVHSGDHQHQEYFQSRDTL